MKVLALVLLVVAAAQARSAAPESQPLAAIGENPSVVHIRLAVSTSGLLNTCGGSLVSSGVVLTSASCIVNYRFIWLRFGVVEVIQPKLVLETSNVGTNAAGLARVITNTIVQENENITPIPLAGQNEELPEVGKVCVFGESANGGPGENLKCLNLELSTDGTSDILGTPVTDKGQLTSFDLGAALVADGKQFGVLVGVSSEDNIARFVKVADHINWIITGNAEEHLTKVDAVKVVDN